MCDGVAQCEHGEDEQGCGKMITFLLYKIQQTHNEFTCKTLTVTNEIIM